MKIKISIDKSWLRADFVRQDGSPGRNLFHTARCQHLPLLAQVQGVIDWCRYYGPDSKEEIEFVTDPAYENLIAAASK